MRLFKFGKIREVPNATYTKEYYDVKYVSDPEEDKARSSYVYSILYDIIEWDLKNIPTYIDIEFKTKISKKFKKKKSSLYKKPITQKE